MSRPWKRESKESPWEGAIGSLAHCFCAAQLHVLGAPPTASCRIGEGCARSGRAASASRMLGGAPLLEPLRLQELLPPAAPTPPAHERFGPLPLDPAPGGLLRLARARACSGASAALPHAPTRPRRPLTRATARACNPPPHEPAPARSRIGRHRGQHRREVACRHMDARCSAPARHSPASLLLLLRASAQSVRARAGSVCGEGGGDRRPAGSRSM